jgi:hypothetical protein
MKTIVFNRKFTLLLEFYSNRSIYKSLIISLTYSNSFNYTSYYRVFSACSINLIDFLFYFFFNYIYALIIILN